MDDLEINIEEFKRFLTEAKRKNCRRNGKFYFSREVYSDRKLEFVGLLDGGRIWQMEIQGGMLPDYEGDKELKEKVRGVVDEMLVSASPEKPFRGPECRLIRRGNLLYFCRTIGDVDSFRGFEHIFSELSYGGGCNKVYKLEFEGGFRR